MTYVTVTAPAAAPLNLAEAKAHLRLDGNAEDDYLRGLIAVAADHLERTTGLCPIRRTLRLALQPVPEDGVIQILRGPLQSIDRVTLYDAEGAPSDTPPDTVLFERDGPPCRLELGRGFDRSRAENGIEIEFTAGFGASGAEVPDSLRRAMLLHVALMYDYRGGVTLDSQPAAVPGGYDRLVAPFLTPRL